MIKFMCFFSNFLESNIALMKKKGNTYQKEKDKR